MDAIAFRLHKKLGAELPDLEGLELSWLVIGAAEAGAYELCDRALERQLERASAPGRLFRPPRLGPPRPIPQLRDPDLRRARAWRSPRETVT